MVTATNRAEVNTKCPPTVLLSFSCKHRSCRSVVKFRSPQLRHLNLGQTHSKVGNFLIFEEKRKNEGAAVKRRS